MRTFTLSTSTHRLLGLESCIFRKIKDDVIYFQTVRKLVNITPEWVWLNFMFQLGNTWWTTTIFSNVPYLLMSSLHLLHSNTNLKIFWCTMLLHWVYLHDSIHLALEQLWHVFYVLFGLGSNFLFQICLFLDRQCKLFFMQWSAHFISPLLTIGNSLFLCFCFL